MAECKYVQDSFYTPMLCSCGQCMKTFPWTKTDNLSIELELLPNHCPRCGVRFDRICFEGRVYARSQNGWASVTVVDTRNFSEVLATASQ
jgi:predicted amidophosphoribosyltransferase